MVLSLHTGKYDLGFLACYMLLNANMVVIDVHLRYDTNRCLHTITSRGQHIERCLFEDDHNDNVKVNGGKAESD